MEYYRQKLAEAVHALVDAGDLNLRLTHAAGCLIQLDDEDVPVGGFAQFEQMRDSLIEKPLVSNGEMVPRDLGEAEAKATAHGIPELLVSGYGGR